MPKLPNLDEYDRDYGTDDPADHRSPSFPWPVWDDPEAEEDEDEL